MGLNPWNAKLINEAPAELRREAGEGSGTGTHITQLSSFEIAVITEHQASLRSFS